MEEQAREVAALLKVLANENRLLILCTLLESAATVTELQKAVPNIGQSALSQHLAQLRSHGLVDSEKQGQNVRYHLADEGIAAVMAVLREHYCQGH
ncbi:MAG: metalloregulator ArsR/SmtB family transcription factor [Bacillota bacterium]|nr:metalloregulator ArsR/SmtB family transcription factor [Bacillota bacterium]